MPPRSQPPAAIDLTVERVPIEQVRYDVDNTRRHNNRNLDAIEASLRKFGQRKPLVVDQDYVAVAGNGTLSVIRDRLGWDYVTVSVFPGTADEARAYGIADNHSGDLSEFDDLLLGAALEQMSADLIAATGIDSDRVAELLAIAAEPAGGLLAGLGSDEAGFGELTPPPSYTEPDSLPEHAEQVITQAGDVWLLGPHRIGCGDSTDPATVRALLGDAVPVMLHADPPYGMGKEADGVLNDNQYREQLDRFQMNWWTAWRDGLADNGSVYIWGVAASLWRLWYVGGLSDEDLTIRNEIVWDKETGMGMRDPNHHSYPTVTERCLFLMRGTQFLGNQNKDEYWEGYEPLRSWLEEQVLLAGWTKRDVNRITGTNMAGHWLSKSQFSPIPERHYTTLQQAATGGAFRLPYDELFSTVFADRAGGNSHRRDLAAELRANRSHFDNTHDVMSDVWRYPRVAGEERFGHATPKPVAMVERAMRSSSRDGDVIGVPFAGTGPEFIAGHRLGRRVYGLELTPRYVDTICRRYQQHTGLVPVLASTGEEHDFTT